jgi:predicted signal transduction protein with EAL and GGDEF domain
VMFARQLGLRIVAEGVETAAVWDWLHTHGCTFAQGYYLSRPADGTAFTAWLHARDRRPETGDLPRLRLVPADATTAAPSIPAAVIDVAPATPVSRDAG